LLYAGTIGAAKTARGNSDTATIVAAKLAQNMPSRLRISGF
ncbi:MAG: hypothetical protein QOE14_1709, partial [Humisphaera sp.]|nr:hypothetical protein [Humisphaera sp.]